MPIDDLTALGDALRAARKEKNLTQEQLADESHVSTKQIADIEKARRNPSYLILKALAKVVHLSLDSLMYPDLSPDEAGQNEMKLLYMEPALLFSRCFSSFITSWVRFLYPSATLPLGSWEKMLLPSALISLARTEWGISVPNTLILLP